jgi:Tfp pilus assembly protein PilX
MGSIHHKEKHPVLRIPVKHSEKGFALVLAILACLILLSFAILAFMLSTQDSRLSSRIVGEKKALAAAEAGIHALTYSFDPTALAAVANMQVDGTNDPHSLYSITAATRPTGASTRPLSGYAISGGQLWGMELYNTSVFGQNTSYNSHVTVDVQFGYGPIEIGTMYR